MNLLGERRSGRRRGVIVGTALLASLLGGGIWNASVPAHSTPEAATCQVFAGRAGQLPCRNPYANTPDSRFARQFVGTTGTGCLLGLIFGGPAGAAAGCVSGAAGNIPWN